MNKIETVLGVEEGMRRSETETIVLTSRGRNKILSKRLAALMAAALIFTAQWIGVKRADAQTTTSTNSLMGASGNGLIGGSFNAVRFNPAISQLNFLFTEGAFTLPHLTPSMGAYVHYDKTPLQVEWNGGETADGRKDGDVFYELIDHQLNMDIGFAMGFFNYFELGVALPITIDQGFLGRDVLDLDSGASYPGQQSGSAYTG